MKHKTRQIVTLNESIEENEHKNQTQRDLIKIYSNILIKENLLMNRYLKGIYLCYAFALKIEFVK